MKTILIPTDFNEQSVSRAQVILNYFSIKSGKSDNLNGEKIRVLFFHAYKLTDSISDLLMLRRRTAEYGQIPPAFHDACNQLKIENPQTIYSIGIEYFYGSTMAAFRNFIEANEVDVIFYPEDYNFQKISKYSLDPELFLRKSGLPVIKPIQPAQIPVEKVTRETIETSVSEMA